MDRSEYILTNNLCEVFTVANVFDLLKDNQVFNLLVVIKQPFMVQNKITVNKNTTIIQRLALIRCKILTV